MADEPAKERPGQTDWPEVTVMHYYLVYFPNLPGYLLGQAEGAAPPAGDAGAGGFLQQFFGNPINLILFSLILFMLLVVRPQRTEMKRLQQMVAGLKKNDRVVTNGGIHGVVVQANTGEPTVIIRIDENSGARLTINRDSIAKVVDDEGSSTTK